MSEICKVRMLAHFEDKKPGCIYSVSNIMGEFLVRSGWAEIYEETSAQPALEQKSEPVTAPEPESKSKTKPKSKSKTKPQERSVKQPIELMD